MASTEGPARAHDRHARRRPFANWMKRLANLKSSHSDSNTQRQFPSPSKGKKTVVPKYNTYPYSQGEPGWHARQSSTNPSSSHRSRHSSISRSKNSISFSQDGQPMPKSRAPTLATTAETTVSGADTVATTAGRTDGGRDSTFSSPSPSLRSMTTTLTTMQSTAPANGQGNQLNAPNPVTTAQTVQPAPALPTHLTPTGHPVTYQMATANNVLTDDASVLTLASSTKRRRRNSVDSKASIRALAPASMFGGSRESLPLSVLSGTIINPGGYGDNGSIRDTASMYYPRSTSAMNAERASLISASGIPATALASDRNSYISMSRTAGDATSVRSGLLGHGVGDREGATSRTDRLPFHGRNDSLGGISIGANSLLREAQREAAMVTAPTSPMPQ